MKSKAKAQFNLQKEDASEQEIALYQQLKDITDDVKALAGNGVSFNDNTNSIIKQLKVNSGVEINLGQLIGKRAVGAQILHTDSSVVTSFKTRLINDGTIAATIELNPAIATLTFLIYGAE